MTAANERRIGPWRLLRELGAGGMGVVWLAERADGAFEGRAAVKLVRVDLATPELVRALERERAVLARLEHPGIARLLDGGAAPDGRTYLAREYVDGRPIDRYCWEERLSVRARVELLLAVCDAVRHAHRALVVHRDLKPANVLVEPDGRPRLLDFGIAGAVDEDATRRTRALAAAGTLAYASPEQLAGGRAGVASDVYSLGVLLYRVLTGRLPFELESAGELEALRILAEQDPRRPSDTAADRATARELRGDLDRILLCALEREPARRYASVERLAADLRAYLEHRPVAARTDTLRYRAGKYLRRNRISVSALSLGAGVLLAVFGTSTVQFVRAERARGAEREQRTAAERRLAETLRLGEELGEQRAVAERRFVDARRFATGLIFELSRRVDGISRVAEASALVLDTGLRFLDHLAEEAPDDPVLLEELARGYLRHADLQDSSGQRSLGDAQAAAASLERALAVTGRLSALDPGCPEVAELSAEVYFRRGVAELAAGRFADSRSWVARAIEACEGHPSEDFGLLRTLVRVRVSMAGLLSEAGRTSEALEHFAAAAGTYDDMVALRPGTEMFVRGDRAFVQSQLCRLWVVAQDPARAVACGEPALDVLNELIPVHRADERLLRAHLTAMASLAEAYLDLERLEEADELLARHRAEAESLVAVDPDDPFALELLHGNHWRRAIYHTRLDQLELARRESLACLGVGRRIAELDPDDTTLPQSQAIVLQRLGDLERRLDLPDEAQRHLEEGLRHLDALLQSGADHPGILRAAYRTHRNLGRLHLHIGHPEQAQASYAAGLELYRRIERQGALTPVDRENLPEMVSGAE